MWNLIPGESTRFYVKAKEYMRKLDGDATIGCSCLVRVVETQQVYTAQDKVNIDLPELSVQVGGKYF